MTILYCAIDLAFITTRFPVPFNLTEGVLSSDKSHSLRQIVVRLRAISEPSDDNDDNDGLKELIEEINWTMADILMGQMAHLECIEILRYGTAKVEQFNELADIIHSRMPNISEKMIPQKLE